VPLAASVSVAGGATEAPASFMRAIGVAPLARRRSNYAVAAGRKSRLMRKLSDSHNSQARWLSAYRLRSISNWYESGNEAIFWTP